MAKYEEDVATALLAKHRITTKPIPVEEIARAEGIEVLRQRFDGEESGFALRQGTRIIIGVNASNSSRRQRFTIAHELGHIALHDGHELIVDSSVRIHFRDRLSSLATDTQEIQANAYAAALLMPASAVFGELPRIYEADMSRTLLVTKLARVFDVSSEAMSYRLVNLGILSV